MTDNYIKPRLVVLGRNLAGAPNTWYANLQLKQELAIFDDVLDVVIDRAEGVPMPGSDPVRWHVVGEGLMVKIGVPRRKCDLYVGVKTERRDFTYKRTLGNRYDFAQVGERGYELAVAAGIPAVLLDRYSVSDISDFVMRENAKVFLR